MFRGIEISKNWKVIEKISKGWSSDEKYYIEDELGNKYILRISDKKKYDKKKRDVEYLKQLEKFNLNIPKVVSFGYCDNGEKIYKLLTFVEGKELVGEIQNFSEKEQYELGLESGRILKKIHSIPIENQDYTWEEKFNKKIDRNIKTYNECPLKFDGAENVIKYINENRRLLNGKKMVFHHGDYHIGNMVVDKDGNLGIIDFDRADIGEAYEEFNRITWCGNISPSFASGRIDGYFENKIPQDFFKLLALYIGSNQLSSLPWSISFGEGQIKTMREEISKVMKSYDDFRNFIPSWYVGKSEKEKKN